MLGAQQRVMWKASSSGREHTKNKQGWASLQSARQSGAARSKGGSLSSRIRGGDEYQTNHGRARKQQQSQIFTLKGKSTGLIVPSSSRSGIKPITASEKDGPSTDSNQYLVAKDLRKYTQHYFHDFVSTTSHQPSVKPSHSAYLQDNLQQAVSNASSRHLEKGATIQTQGS